MGRCSVYGKFALRSRLGVGKRFEQLRFTAGNSAREAPDSNLARSTSHHGRRDAHRHASGVSPNSQPFQRIEEQRSSEADLQTADVRLRVL